MTETSALQSLLDNLSSRLSTVEAKLGVQQAAPVAAVPQQAGEDARFIKAFDEYCRDYLDPFVKACEELGCTGCSDIVKKGWGGMREYLVMASKCRKPASFPDACLPFLKVCQEANLEASAAVQRGDFEFHQKTVAEGLQACSWLIVEPAPKDFVETFIGGSDFWANKIRVQYKKTNPAQIAFCDTFKQLITQLMPYVKEYHMTGVTFNPHGMEVAAYSPASAPPAAAPKVKTAPKVENAATGGLADLKNALGSVSTSGLKKVTKDMQTWRSEYKGEKAPVGKAPVTKAAPPKKKQTVTKGPPLMEFQSRGMKWIVENQTKENGVITITMDPKEGVKHTVYICTCYEATIDIKGKCKSVAVDSCQKCNVLFDSAISSLEVVNCRSMKCQTRGTVPSVAIDKTDGILTYLSPETIDITQFVTSKSSDMQISFPNKAGDMVEAPIPEQFIHKAKLGADEKPSVTSDVSDLYSH
mmetsp:Transcript_1435/g.1886  ORF Transcript_1435/g.1886 Transcript_1435/m.1886 type:complete len:471 (-) Transcript_1435:417-1829(-)|eukprot:CAMPEP_0197312064 /NCGR_PEP_ID=MMETSP0891-20130614/16944_1 /TAXON_ID=44058 ORGANISM="Aureoumbra lagunensis, Strain CCMP1510" /NCGR_SAMPLE_ID=MMETSP0891 /ASSEMBLY_ACC=CAM_ASM_000534 /LENGTH=470 /DNA_ID=CAMNT_0042798853 /DNA_START=44 /DNA_END=1456 /DNA_ORIENTATION=+